MENNKKKNERKKQTKERQKKKRFAGYLISSTLWATASYRIARIPNGKVCLRCLYDVKVLWITLFPFELEFFLFISHSNI